MYSTPESVSAELIDASKPDQAYFFSLNLSPQSIPKLLIGAGDPGSLGELNMWHELIDAWRWPASLCSTERVTKIVPGGSVDTLSQSFQSLLAYDVLAIGFGLHIGSAEQLMIEQALRQTSMPWFVTAELLPLFIHDRALCEHESLMPVLAVSEYISLANKLRLPVHTQPGKGIYNVASLLLAMPFASPVLCTYDAERAYIFLRDEKKLLHVPRDANMSRSQVRVWLTSVIALLTYNHRVRGGFGAHARAALCLLSQVRADMATAEAVRVMRQYIETAAV
ncbi:hypothetical protein E6P97_04005 [Patescibacteria group bacterium]|nr:MAG: hypothetical protein E6P97_04005 [Patescibacteria group bacterium]